jgi:hypothetical protein
MVETEVNKEAWMDDGTSGDQPAVMPQVAHMSIKNKLKGRIADRDSTIASLEAKVAALEAGKNQSPNVAQPTPGKAIPSVPKRAEYDDDDSYFEAVDKYHDAAAQDRYARLDAQNAQKRQVQQAHQTVQQATESHFDRAAKLVESTGISPDLYKAADLSVRKAVESILPGAGDTVTDQLIANMGEGSEKVMYYVGNNVQAQAQFKSLLAEDRSGLKAAIYLGEQKTRLTKPHDGSSHAPAPAPELGGGDGGSPAGTQDFKKIYDAADKADDPQAKINAKLDAKRAGVDVSKW